jgi:hypothetical protein
MGWYLMKESTGYSVLKQLAIFGCAVAVLLFAGQLREGSAFLLVGSAALFAMGLLLAILADLGLRLGRLEQRVRGVEQQRTSEQKDDSHIGAAEDDVSRE